jgi:hypothetical protein
VKPWVKAKLNSDHTVEIEVIDCAGNKFTKSRTFKVDDNISNVALLEDFDGGTLGTAVVVTYDGACDWAAVLDTLDDSGFAAASLTSGCFGLNVCTGLQTPPLDFTSIDPPIYLSWQNSANWSMSFDSCVIRISTDGGNTWHDLMGNYFDGESFISPFTYVIDLSAYAHSSYAIIEFLYCTPEATDIWEIDDVMIYSGPTGGIPTLTEWGMIVFCLLLLGWMVRMFICRGKRFASSA